MNKLKAIVQDKGGIYFELFAKDAPPHLRFLNLLSSQMMGAKVGDKVTLEYQVTSRSGLWNVISIDKE